MRLRWALLCALLLAPLCAWGQITLPAGPFTTPGATFTTPTEQITLPGGNYTIDAPATFRPKPPDAPPPLPAPTGSIYLQVLRDGKLGWEDREGDRPYRVGFQVTAPVALVVVARGSMGTVVPADITVRYTLDGQPVSPPLSTAPFKWTWDATGLRGAHALCLEVSGPSRESYRPIASMAFGAVLAGAQRLPLLPQWLVTDLPTEGRGSFAPCTWGDLDYDPARQLAQEWSWRSRGVRSDEIDTTKRIPAAGWVVEPAGHAPMQGYGAGIPAVLARGPLQPDGQPVARAWHAQAGDWSEFSTPKVERGPHVDGPRGVAIDSPYATCVGLPSASSPRYLCVNEAGRVYETADGAMRTLYGPRQAHDAAPVEHVGRGAPLKGPQDISVFPGIEGLAWVANTFDHTIERLDCRVEPCTLTTIGGQRGKAGKADGPAASSAFNRPYSIITHGPHPCPGRPELGETCYHHYVADLRNHSIRTTGLYRPQADEIPEWTTLTSALAQPMVIRWASNWDLIIGETGTGAIKRLRWLGGGAHQIETIAPKIPWNADLSAEKWYWLDVDRLESCGPEDIWVVRKGSDGRLHRIRIDGTLPEEFTGGGTMPHGPLPQTYDPRGHYAWGGDFHSTLAWPGAPKLCAIRVSGFGSMPSRILRPRVASDVFPVVNEACYSRGRTALGSIRPPWMGLTGYARLGLETYAEWAAKGDAELDAAMLALKPSATAAELESARYAVRLTSPRYWIEPHKIACGADPGPLTPLTR